MDFIPSAHGRVLSTHVLLLCKTEVGRGWRDERQSRPSSRVRDDGLCQDDTRRDGKTGKWERALEIKVIGLGSFGF